jgi:biopolymer transport protein ExbD
MRKRRLRKHPVELDISVFLNLIVVLIPFLLSTAVFSRLSIVDMNLPAQSSGALEQLKVNDLQLEVVIRPATLEVGDRLGGLIQSIPNVSGGHDVKALSALMHQIKARYPDKTEATVLAEPTTPYHTLVYVMDAVRSGTTTRGTAVVRADLFPSISVGDAPVRTP